MPLLKYVGIKLVGRQISKDKTRSTWHTMKTCPSILAFSKKQNRVFDDFIGRKVACGESLRPDCGDGSGVEPRVDQTPDVRQFMFLTDRLCFDDRGTGGKRGSSCM